MRLTLLLDAVPKLTKIQPDEHKTDTSCREPSSRGIYWDRTAWPSTNAIRGTVHELDLLRKPSQGNVVLISGSFPKNGMTDDDRRILLAG